MIRIRCYLDGLNFYYGVAKKTGYKWIDLESLFTFLLKQKINQDLSIEQIKIFTSSVSNQEAAHRQAIYFSALKKHSPCISFVIGKFKNVQKTGIALNGDRKGELVKVQLREEKETDVNIAVSMVDDVYSEEKNNFDLACLISNDSNLSTCLLIKRKLKQKIALIAPVVRGEQVAKSLSRRIEKKYRILEIAPKTVKEHRLPEIVDKSSPPDYEGWRLDKND